MPYMPYSDLKKRDKHGNQKWRILKLRCMKCRVDFTTRNPKKEYCSETCRRAEEVSRRRRKNARKDK